MKFQRVLESLQVFRTRQIRDGREITCRAFFSYSEDSLLRTVKSKRGLMISGTYILNAF